MMFIDLYHFLYSWSSICNLAILIALGSIIEFNIEKIFELSKNNELSSSIMYFNFKEIPN